MPDSWLRRLDFNSIKGHGSRRSRLTGQRDNGLDEDRSAVLASTAIRAGLNRNSSVEEAEYAAADNSSASPLPPHWTAESQLASTTFQGPETHWWQRSRRSRRRQIASDATQHTINSATIFDANSGGLGKKRQDRPFVEEAKCEASCRSRCQRRAGSALLQGSTSHWLSDDDDDALGRGRTAAAGSSVSASVPVSASARRCSHAKSIHLFTGRAALPARDEFITTFPFRRVKDCSCCVENPSQRHSRFSTLRKRAQSRLSHFLDFPKKALSEQQQQKQPSLHLKAQVHGCASRPVTPLQDAKANQFAFAGSIQDRSHRKPKDATIIQRPGTRDSTLASSIDIYQPHPFGVWHRNQEGPTSLPPPPRRSASASFVRAASDPRRPSIRHPRNVHSLGTLPDLDSVIVTSSSVPPRHAHGRSLGYAQVRAAGFPFIMPDSGSEGTRTPATELASEVGSLRRFHAPSDAGSASMSRSFSDHPSMRSYEESSVSAKGPSATISRSAGEHIGSSLREEMSPSQAPMLPDPVPSSSLHHEPLPSVLEQSPIAHDARSDHDAPTAAESELAPEPDTEAAALQPWTHSNASVDSASSPIMKMRAPAITTPSLRDFPVNADHNPGFESVNGPLRQRTDSRPAISPTGTSRAISTPAPMPLPQALQDTRPTVRRAEGQRAESEVVRSRSSTKPFNFPARSSAQFTPRERANIISAGQSHSKNGGSFIRRLIRRASLKGNKSQSRDGKPTSADSTHKTSVALSSELDMQEDAAATTPRSEKFSSRGRPQEQQPLTFTQRRSKSKEAGASKIPRASSIFAPFRARDPSKAKRPRTERQDSFGHLGPLPRDDDPPYPIDGLPLSSSSPFLARDPDFADFTPSTDDDVKSRDFVIIGRQPRPATTEQPEATETLRSPEMTQQGNMDEDEGIGSSRRQLSHSTDQTGDDFNTSSQGRSSSDEVFATPRQVSNSAYPGAKTPTYNQAVASSAGHSKTTEGHARPRPGIPRIWQGLEPVDADYSMRSTHIDDADSSDDTPPDHHLPANRFDTATTTSSFRTAATHFDSPKSTAARRLGSESKASRVSLRTLDTPLARHFDHGPRQDSPLADLITNLERRLSARSTSGQMRSTPYHEAIASPSSELLHQDPELERLATAEAPSTSSLTGHDGQHYHYDEEDDDASLHAEPHQPHLPAASHTALVETLDRSNRNSLVGPSSLTSQETSEAANGVALRSKRDTFGGLDSMPFTSMDAGQGDSVAHQKRPQLSRFSTATAGAEEQDQTHLDHVQGDASEEQEVVVPEVKVSEIESHLAAVEAALQDNRDEGSFDLTSLRQRMSDSSYGMHANASSTSMLSRDGMLQPTTQAANKSTDELSLPGAWTQDSSSFVMSDDGRRITLAPESHDALADAVRSVRRAISSSQLTDKDESPADLANRSVDTLGMDSFVSDTVEPDSERKPIADVSMLSEATPARAAKRRQEGMRDIEEAYSRMLALVQSSAIGVTPSPQMRGDEARLGFEPPRRPMKHGQATSGASELFQNSPLAKASTKTDEPLSQTAQTTRNILDASVHSQPQRSQARALPGAETRTSTSLSGLMGMPLDINPQMLRTTSASTVGSAHAHDIAQHDPAEVSTFRRRPPSVAKSGSSRYSQALSRDLVASSLIDSDSFRKRFSTDNTTVGRASSGAGHTSPSATAKTLGTPRSFATSASQHSLANLVRRHELEKESLLDTLEVVRAENHDMHARYDRLTSDLHAEVTRVLELERELERRDSREVTLIDQIQNLESELMELRYLDFQLNSTADQTLGSEDGEGSIMDVELPPSLRSKGGIRDLPFSPRGGANQVISPPPSFSSASISAQLKPTHRSTRSEAFAGLPGPERATLPTSRSELPRARPVSLLNGPGGLFRDDRGSQRSSQASPLPTPRSSSLLRHPHRACNKPAQPRQASPTLLGLSLPKDDSDVWNIPDEQLPEIEDEILPTPLRRPHEEAPMLSAPADTIDSRLGDNGHLDDSCDEDRQSTVQHDSGARISSNGLRDVSSSLPRSTSEATVTKSTTASQLPRASMASKIPTSRSTSGSISRLPRLGLPSSRYTASGVRTVSGATDKSTASSVYSTGAPPSLGSLPSGNNTMEEEIQAELKRLGNPKPFMRYYSPPRSKMV